MVLAVFWAVVLGSTCALATPLEATGVRAQWYSNAVLAPPSLHCPRVAPSTTFALAASSAICPGGNVTTELFSARFDATLTAPLPGATQFAVETNGAVRLWLDDHILVDTSCVPCTHNKQTTDASHGVGRVHGGPCCKEWRMPSNASVTRLLGRDNVTRNIEKGLHLRLEWLHYGGGPANLTVLWRPGIPSTRTDPEFPAQPQDFQPIPASALTPVVSRAESWRQDLQANLSRGWNTWMRDSAARHVHLPTAVGIEIELFDAKTGETFSRGLVDKCAGANAASCKIIPGFHSFNGSYSSYTQRTAWTDGLPTVNVTISSGHTDADGDSLVLLIEPSVLGTTLWVNFTVGFFFDCALQGDDSVPDPGHFLPACGSITRDNAVGSSFTALPSGMQTAMSVSIPAAADGPSGPSGSLSALVPLANGPAVLSAALGGKHAPSVEQAKAIVSARLREVEADFESSFPRSQVGRMRDGAEAMRTVIGWNTVWDQRVKVVTPVSRTFGVNPWIMWDWDTYFASLLAAESSELLGYTNVLTVTRGRAIRGNVPNAECAAWTNDDRSEPYVGALTVREHYRKFGENRLVELLYDDLLAWNDWALNYRTLKPDGLISVGSDEVNTPPFDGHTKQAAIWETGMDNSPMYDEVTWDGNVSKMLIYDIGMSSEFVAEADALADLAEVLNKTSDAAMLRARRDAMAAKIQAHLWSEDAGLYFNFQVDTSMFNAHSSPTSFYPMISGTATEEQAIRMVREWMANATRYCVCNNSGSPAPNPPNQSEPTEILRLWWSSTFEDNAICLENSQFNCGYSLETASVDAKHASSWWRSRTECCPPQVEGPYYTYIRDESSTFILPSAGDRAAYPDIELVELRLFYSHANRDNFLGVNATQRPGYVVVRAGRTDGNGHLLPEIVGSAFATQPNESYVPLDLYWSETRKDYQTVGSEVTRRWLDGYVLVQRLGWVLPATGYTPVGKCAFGLPSTPFDDPAFGDNSYWRGRLWGPLNFLVYMGLRHPRYANLPDVEHARKLLVNVSREALLVEWLPKHHVHENLNPQTGLGDDVSNSNPMYHWGALLTFLEIWESGRF